MDDDDDVDGVVSCPGAVPAQRRCSSKGSSVDSSRALGGSDDVRGVVSEGTTAPTGSSVGLTSEGRTGRGGCEGCVRMLCDAEPSPSITAGPLNPFLPDRLHLLYTVS